MNEVYRAITVRSHILCAPPSRPRAEIPATRCVEIDVSLPLTSFVPGTALTTSIRLASFRGVETVP